VLAVEKAAAPPNSPPKIKTIQALLKTADIPVAEIAARFGVARSTLYRAVLNPAA
jgi:predicted transcriptional regulator